MAAYQYCPPDGSISFLLNGNDSSQENQNCQEPKIRGHHQHQHIDPNSPSIDSQYSGSGSTYQPSERLDDEELVEGGSSGGGGVTSSNKTDHHHHQASKSSSDDIDLAHMSADERRRYRNRMSQRASRERKKRAVLGLIRSLSPIQNSVQSQQQQQQQREGSSPLPPSGVVPSQSMPYPLPYQFIPSVADLSAGSPPAAAKAYIPISKRLEIMEERINELTVENFTLRERISRANAVAAAYAPISHQQQQHYYQNQNQMPLLQRAVFSSMNQSAAAAAAGAGASSLQQYDPPQQYHHQQLQHPHHHKPERALDVSMFKSF
ncbi:hypothetical protein BDR26DRAFT_852574 [Obelidium mucronatum]|nr:hypothetical protein BDR26DRAFT_852574 [Obelidium mucronatum]